jgi:DNA-binding GntR family transcriptional regulator
MNSLAEPIKRKTLHGELVGRLRTLIIEGYFPPGEKLGEQEICDRFHVSRTPLREALKVLAGEGLVEIVPNRGARVARLTAADLDEAFPVMGALEALAGELACRNISDIEVEAIGKVHARMVGHHRAGRLSDYFRDNEMIHDMILMAADNRTLSKMQHGLAGRVRRARYRANMTPERWAAAVAEHEEIFAALEARDGKRLGKVLKRHLANKLEAVKASLQDG